MDRTDKKSVKILWSNYQFINSKISKNNWVYFESGAGFTEDKTIPLLTDNLKPRDLTPPMSLLQAREVSEIGIEAFIKDLSKKLGLREPKSYPSIKDLVFKIEKILRTDSTLQLQKQVPKFQFAPNAVKQWIYLDICLVYDFLIEKKQIVVDTYFYIDRTEIQLFDRSNSTDYLINTMCHSADFLPRPLTEYEMTGHRLIFKKFGSTEEVDAVATSLIDLLTRIENYKKSLN
jgi:hypothetical protein